MRLLPLPTKPIMRDTHKKQQHELGAYSAVVLTPTHNTSDVNLFLCSFSVCISCLMLLATNFNLPDAAEWGEDKNFDQSLYRTAPPLLLNPIQCRVLPIANSILCTLFVNWYTTSGHFGAVISPGLSISLSLCLCP